MKTIFAHPQVKEIFQVAAAVMLGIGLAPLSSEAQDLARLHIECNECDSDHLKEQLSFVDIVRDRLLADVRVLITSLPTGSGGRSYRIDIAGLIRGKPQSDTTTVNLGPNVTGVEARDVLARRLRIALVPFIRENGAAAFLDVTYEPLAAAKARGANDPWNKWVFRIGGSGSFGSDENYSSRGADGSIGATRISEEFKFDASAKGSFNREKFLLDSGRVVRSDRHNWSVKTLSVWSGGNNVSFGMSGSAGSSAFENTRFDLRIMPAIEYNLFRYSEATTRQVILRYSAGIRSSRYVDTTIYGLTAESRPVHELLAVSDIRQQWGAVWGKASWSQYLHDFSKRRLSIDTGIDWRVVAGLSLDVGINYSLVRDQLNVRGSSLTDEERLLRLREIASGYSISGGVGLTYTFGSVFTNIVNSRFRL